MPKTFKYIRILISLFLLCTYMVGLFYPLIVDAAHSLYHRITHTVHLHEQHDDHSARDETDFSDKSSAHSYYHLRGIPHHHHHHDEGGHDESLHQHTHPHETERHDHFSN